MQLQNKKITACGTLSPHMCRMHTRFALNRNYRARVKFWAVRSLLALRCARCCEKNELWSKSSAFVRIAEHTTESVDYANVIPV